MAKTILVTGANGHLGSNVIRALINKGYAVRPFVRRDSDLRGLQPLSLEYYYGDVRDQQVLVRACSGCDAIIHLAAVYKLWASTPEEFLQPAIEGTRNIFVAARKAGIQRLIYTSSVTAVGAGSTPAYRTEDDWNEDMSFPYALAKTESEKIAWQLSKEMNVPMIALCPGHILGRLDYRITPSNRIILDMVSGLGLTIEMGLSTVDVRDAAEIFALAVERGEPGHRFIVTGKSLMMKDLGKMVQAMTGTKVFHLPFNRSLNIVSGYFMDLAARLSGWEPPMPSSVAKEYSHRYMFFNNAKMLKTFEHSTLPLEDTLSDTIAWLAHIGKVSKNLTKKFPPAQEWKVV